ncbi:MAG TPA: diguanylate cyclase [Candidatus Cybelea sp.]|nr:diguanylate cyclase [Candidatus Cybelea sp.]
MSLAARILVVEADPDRAAGITARLAQHGYASMVSRNGREALPLAIGGATDIVLVGPGNSEDAAMLTDALGQRPSTRALPVIVLDGPSSSETGDEPEDMELLARMRSLLRLNTMQEEWSRRRETLASYGLVPPDPPRIPRNVDDARVIVVSNDPESIVAALANVAVVTPIANAYLAMQQLVSGEIDVVVTSIDDALAEEFCRDIRANTKLFHLPVVVIVQQQSRDVLRSGASEVMRPGWTPEDLRSRVAALAGMQRYRQRLTDTYRVTRHPVTCDSLADVFSYGFLLDHLALQIAATRRSGKPLTLGCFDVVGMAEINNAHGYAAGDLVIRQIGHLIRRLTRAEDLPARLGGARFCVSLPDTSAEEAANVIRRISGIVGRTAFSLTGSQESLTVELRCGVAECDSKDTPERLIARAQKAFG